MCQCFKVTLWNIKHTLFYTELTVVTCFLSVSPSPPDADPKMDGEVTLECSLSRGSRCRQDSLRWLDDTGAVLRGEGVGYRVLGQTDCVSGLTVKRQSGDNRRYTCQFVDGDKVQIGANYPPDVTGNIISKKRPIKL